MSVSERYRTAWEGFWGATSGAPGEAIWDSDPVLTDDPCLELLAPHADATLPVVDVGCGNGTRTRWLAGRFPRAVGVDLSRTAVDLARRADPKGLAVYEQLDVVDAAAVESLRERLGGDGNVHMRGVIHQCDPQDRAPVAAAVAHLTGTRGRALVVELTRAAAESLHHLTQTPAGPPPKLRRVLQHDLRPADAPDGEVPRLLRASGLQILAEGETTLAMTEHHPDGRRIDLPGHWFLAGRA
ncbi:methyltransferase domain-containing protein [Streptomyces sp. SCA3-4]|uniref:class I SAM-dependent methyltransferase n=1 Tax=Streptomyces sichuanensis TaxID=2871810 RepID=UPI001CE37840|nr:class I SAM-dependent methyltransferase [Streptomyces sichuanensis]MCA6090785.1 methyltransferase domain-containing protein [Streptomyces sichuanensis]